MSPASCSSAIAWERVRAVGLDLMDTILYDPFRDAVPEVTGLTLDEIGPLRDRQAFFDFELGKISENEYGRRFFRAETGRQLDVQRLWNALEPRFTYLNGMEQLLGLLAERLPIHVMSNYSPWYERLKERFGLDRFVVEHFPSYVVGSRKPDARYFATVLERTGLAPCELLFIDDREVNVEGACAAGLPSLLFAGDARLRAELAPLLLRRRLPSPS